MSFGTCSGGTEPGARFGGPAPELERELVFEDRFMMPGEDEVVGQDIPRELDVEASGDQGSALETAIEVRNRGLNESVAAQTRSDKLRRALRLSQIYCVQ